MIALSEIHFSYGAADVLKGISLNAAAGEIIGILGPNGAGKSTLIKVMAGILRAQRGSVAIEGSQIESLPKRLLAQKIAVVSQVNTVPFSFSAIEIVLMGRAPHLPMLGFESARDLEIARAAMRQTDCLEFAPRNVNELSGGERQRIFLARALAQEPKILLLDEPTTFLDIGHQMSFLRTIGRLNRERRVTIIAAMHDLNLACAFCGRIVLLRDGRVCADGDPKSVITGKLVAEVFGTGACVRISEHSGRPYAVLTDFE